MCKSKFYVCKHCGNIIGMVHDAGVPVVCCGEKMSELVPNSVEASTEKHVPVVKIDGSTVKVTVSTVAHPMTAEHYIPWIYVQTEKGGQRKCLNPNDKPEVTFNLQDDKYVATFAYCNLHGLWTDKK